jgi:hypothetical protein
VQETGGNTHLCAQSNDILCVKVLSSGLHTHTCPSACFRTESRTSIFFLFFSSFGVLPVPDSLKTSLNVPNP